MKAVLISIQPKWCELIASGKKTVEVRKTAPKLPTPFKCYIYCTNKKPFLVWGDVFRGSFVTEFTHLSGCNRKDAEKTWEVFNGRVMGEFVCDSVERFTTDYRRNEKQLDRISRQSCLCIGDLMEYEGGSYCLYGWHISDLVIYDDPKPLSEFYKCGAVPMKDLDEELCSHCAATDCGEEKECHTPSGVWMCEGRWCDEAYQAYLDEEFSLTRAPQSWCYVEG